MYSNEKGWGKKLAKKQVKKKIMMRVIKNVMGWRKKEVALAQVTRKGFLERVTFELQPEVKGSSHEEDHGEKKKHFRQREQGKRICILHITEYKY